MNLLLFNFIKLKMSNITIKIKKTLDNAQIPVQATQDDVGYDLFVMTFNKDDPYLPLGDVVVKKVVNSRNNFNNIMCALINLMAMAIWQPSYPPCHM